MSVKWRTLSLEGFGKYSESVTAEFADGLNTLVGPNESGKSTLVWALVSVLFGLSGQSAASAFGTARFRSWDAHRRFWGELMFSVDETYYRISRDFGTYRVKFESSSDAVSWNTLVSGEHNPSAHRRNVRYEKMLGEIIGVHSRDLFLRTFCVEQPMPEMQRIDESVQQIVLGSGGSVQHALLSLLDRVRSITRYNAELGVGSANARVDRELESLRQNVRDAESQLAEHTRVLDSLASEEAELRRQEQRKKDIEELLKQKRGALSLWHEWHQKRQAYDGALRSKSQIARALETLIELRRSADALGKRIKVEFAGFDTLPEDTSSILHNISALAAKRDEYRAQAQELDSGLASLTESRRQIILEMNALRHDLSDLGSNVVEIAKEARLQAALFVRNWQRAECCASQIEELSERTQLQFRPFTEADEETLEFVAGYEQKKTALVHDVQMRQADLRRIEERASELAEQELSVDTEFADIRDQSKEHLAAAQTKIEMLTRKRQLAAEIAETENIARGGLSVLPLALAALISFVASGFFLAAYPAEMRIMFQLGVGIIGAMLAHVVLGSSRTSTSSASTDLLRQEMREIQREIGRLSDTLSHHDSDEEATLTRLVARISERDALLERIRREQQALSLSGSERTREMHRLAEQALGAFSSRVAEFERVYPDLSNAFFEWRKMESALERERDRLRELCSGLLDAPQHMCEAEVDNLNHSYASLSRVVALVVPEKRSLRELAKWLAGLDARWWDEFTYCAETYESLHKRFSKASDDSERLQASSNGLLAKARQIDAQIDALGTEVSPLVERFHDIEEARQKYANYNAIVADLNQLNAQAESVLDAHALDSEDALRVRLAESELRLNRALDEWEKLCKKVPSLPAAGTSYDLEAFESMRSQMQEQVAELDEQLTQASLALEQMRDRVTSARALKLVNLSHTHDEIQIMKRRMHELEQKAAAIAIAYREIERARLNYQQTYRERLARAASNRFSELSPGGREVTFDEEFRVQVSACSGGIDIAQLSQGTRDQLYFALRLAVADLLAGDVRLPFILDDPFLTFDSERQERLREMLCQIAQSRQVILLSHREEVKQWGKHVVLRTV